MNSILLTLLLIIQGIPLAPAETGTATGTVRTPDGKPAAGVRVVAVSTSESPETTGAAMFASLTETDNQGRYRLENIPPGPYFIAAGHVQQLTYYPGTLDAKGAAMVRVAAGAVVSGLDFLAENTLSLLESTGRIRITALTIPVRIVTEDRSRIPVYVGGRITELQFIHKNDGTRTVFPLNTPSITGPAAITPSDEFQIKIDNLPDGYMVKSIAYGPTELKDGVLQINRTNLLIPGAASSAALLPLAGIVPVNAPSTQGLTITLADSGVRQPLTGVRVTGHAKYNGDRAVYISGMPGISYSDGTFEFRGVAPGRHAIVAFNDALRSRPLGAAVVVGASDVDGVELDEVSALPFDFGTPIPPGPAEGHPTGSAIPLASLYVSVAEESNREWVNGGTLIVTGQPGNTSRAASSRTGYALLDLEGRFPVHGLFPGTYDLEYQHYGYVTVRRTIIVGEDDIHLELAVRATTN